MPASQAVIAQPSLFGSGRPCFDPSFRELQRHELSRGAWVDYQRGWLAGHETLFDLLLDQVAWSKQRRPMYDRIVDVPRLLGSLPDGLSDHEGDPDGDLDVIGDMGRAITDRYGIDFERVGLALYRDGSDSVAWHGDQVAREMPQAMVATVSIGAPRTFSLRPKGGGSGLRFRLGHGDLVVMGGSCQRTWEHAVPKVAAAGPRIAIMFRPLWSRLDR